MSKLTITAKNMKPWKYSPFFIVDTKQNESDVQEINKSNSYNCRMTSFESQTCDYVRKQESMSIVNIKLECNSSQVEFIT